jgi:hypothetical protein
MFCVEASNVLDYAVEIAPGKQHRLAATIRVAEMRDSAT